MELKEKTINIKHHVKIDERGDVHFQDKEKWDKNKELFIGKDADIILKKPVKERSLQEEKYFHAVVCTTIANKMGISPQEAKEFLKDLLLKTEEVSPEGYRYERTMSTTELGDERYRKFVFEDCVRWAALPTKEEGLGIDSGLELYIPEPGEIDYENL